MRARGPQDPADPEAEPALPEEALALYRRILVPVGWAQHSDEIDRDLRWALLRALDALHGAPADETVAQVADAFRRVSTRARRLADGTRGIDWWAHAGRFRRAREGQYDDRKIRGGAATPAPPSDAELEEVARKLGYTSHDQASPKHTLHGDTR
jgi:hypothetical protein